MWLTSQTRFFNFLFWRFSLFLCRLFSTHAREDVEVRHMWKLHGGVGAQHRFHLMVYKKGYRTESDCAIETAQWRNIKGLGRKLRERDEFVKMKVGSRFFFSVRWARPFFFCANSKSYRMTIKSGPEVQYLPSFPPRPATKPKVFLNCMNGVRLLSLGRLLESRLNKTYRKLYAIVLAEIGLSP